MSNSLSAMDALEECLNAALEAEEDAKNYHIRNALQLLDALRE